MNKLLLNMVLIATLSILGQSPALAYLVGSTNVDRIDYNANTHLLLIGDAGELGSQFLEAAASKAGRINKAFPNRQIIFIQSDEENAKYFFRLFKIKLLKEYSASLNGKRLVKRLDTFKKIDAIEMFTHSNAHTGARFDRSRGKARFNSKTRGVENLTDNFTKDAYVTLNGCSMGFNQAAKLSSIWKIPVRGAFSSTDFQQLHANGNWYFNNPGQYPADGGWRNTRRKAMLRMKPDNMPYTGSWGTFSAGLPFFKFLCNNNGDTSRCKRAMALSMFGFMSNVPLTLNSSFEEYKQVVRDFLCPISAHNDINSKCIQELIDAETTGNEVYSPFNGKMLNCNMNKCQYHYKCSGFLGRGKCQVSQTGNADNKALIQEYFRYLQGFELL